MLTNNSHISGTTLAKFPLGSVSHFSTTKYAKYRAQCTPMSTSLVNLYLANLQGSWTCTGIAKGELSPSPSINIYQHIHTPHDPCLLLHIPTHTHSEHTHPSLLRGVKDWVHMKTAKMMKDFNWLCNLDVNQKLLLIFIIKVVYLCTLHNKIISPAHFVVYVLWRPTPTWFSNINA